MGTNWKIARILWLGVCFALAFATVDLQAGSPQQHDTAKYFLLYSWSDKQNNYYFVLVPRQQEKRFLSGFTPRFSQSYNFNSLRRHMAKLPRGSLIVWEEREPLGLHMPPAA